MLLLSNIGKFLWFFKRASKIWKNSWNSINFLLTISSHSSTYIQQQMPVFQHRIST